MKSLPPSKTERLLYKVLEHDYQNQGQAQKGGKGSGNWGHAGRKGKRGGSLPGSYGFGPGENLEGTVQRLKAAAERRGKKLRDSMLAELENNEDYTSSRDLFRQGREEFHKVRSRYVANAEKSDRLANKYMILREQADAIFDQYHQAELEIEKTNNAIWDLKGKHPRKEKELKKQLTEQKRIADELHAGWYEYRVKADQTDKENRDFLSSEEYQSAYEDYQDGIKKYALSFEDGDHALEVAMGVANKYRQKFIGDKLSNGITRMADSYKTEVESALSKMEYLVSERSRLRKERIEAVGPTSDEERQIIDQQHDLQPKINDLAKRGAVLHEIADTMRRSFLEADQPGRASYTGAYGVRRDVEGGFTSFNRLVPPNSLLEERAVEIKKTDPNIYGGVRPYAGNYQISLPIASQYASTVTHELGHVLERADPWIAHVATKFLERRTAGQTPEKLRDITGNNGYEDHEVAVKDHFTHPYMGKIYPYNTATEIFSMGLQEFSDIGSPTRLAMDDPEYFNLIYSALRI